MRRLLNTFLKKFTNRPTSNIKNDLNETKTSDVNVVKRHKTKGVSFNKRDNKYEAYLLININANKRVKVFIGYYSTLDDAIRAREYYINNLF